MFRKKGIDMKKIFIKGLIFVIVLSLFVPTAHAATLEYTLIPSTVNMDASQTGSFKIEYEPDGLPFAGVDCDLLLPTGVEITGVTYSIPTGGEFIGTSVGSGITNFSKSASSNIYTGQVTCTVSLKYSGTGTAPSEISIAQVRIIRFPTIGDPFAVSLSPAAGANKVSVVPYAGAATPDSTYLSSLTVSPGTLSPAFSPDEFAYVVEVGNNVTSIDVNATAKYPATTTVEITGGTSLIVGNNTITVAVKANAGEASSTYSILVTRLGSGTTSLPGNPSQNDPDGSTTLPDPDPPLAPPPAPLFPFTDVQEGNWFYDDVFFMWENNLMNGTSDTLFSPNSPLTRGMVVTVLYRMENEPDVADLNMPFPDVAAGQWYTDAVKWAAENEIVLGHSNGQFAPNDNVTREQLATILHRYQKFAEQIPPNVAEAREFTDLSSISEYAKESVNALVMQDVIRGRDSGSFDPRGNATRAEFAAMLHRYLLAIEE